MENYFDKVAQNWDANQIHKLRTEAIATELKTNLIKGSNQTALEFGAGTGLLSFALKDYFSKIILLDGSVEMTKIAAEKIAAERIKHLVPLHFDLESDDYKSEPFDMVFTQMAMHHVVDIEKVIAKFFNLVKSGGKVAIADLYTEDGTFHDRDFDGHFGFDPEIFAGILIKCGFQNVKYQQVYVIQRKLDDQTIKNFPVFLMTGEKF